MIPFPDQRDDDPRNGGHTVFLVDSPCLNLDVVEWTTSTSGKIPILVMESEI